MSELLASLRLKGISGGGNGAVITVAYGAEFYNQTLVATNGTDTVSVLASSSGTADIAVPSEGSWVISCTIGADTYTSDPVSVDLSYEATITAIPDGSTVLPTDDIQTWLECAGITDKAYTTLSEVLADTDTYTTLLGDSNACDYMARSTTWASTIVADADAMRLLGMYDYACYVLRQDNTWNTAINNSAYASYIPASPTGQTDIIVSAPSDTIYYMDNGSPVTLCTTDTSGIGSVDWSDLPTGDITLYSSVAKNPTDLTADYSKTIKVTKNKVEGYLMPDTALYWYGYKDALLQDVSTANGWSRSGSWTGTTAPTYQTNYVSLKGSSSTTYSGIGSATSISLSGLTLVINPIALSSASRNGLVSVETTKALPSGTYPTDSNHAWATTKGIQKLVLSPTENNYYPACISATNSQCDLYAMWYE